MNKKGLMVVFEGTDGSGKTTIIDNLTFYLDEEQQDIIYYHWRPGFIKSPNKNSNENRGEVCTNPHGKKPYSKWISIGKFMYFNLDYILGYWFEVKKHLKQGKLVVFDRYYYDYYLDKQRYRLDISDKILKLFSPVIPKPDITFLLIGDAKKLYERKKEISVEEIQQQIDRIIANKCNFANAVIIDVNQGIDAVVKSVAEEIKKF